MKIVHPSFHIIFKKFREILKNKWWLETLGWNYYYIWISFPHDSKCFPHAYRLKSTFLSCVNQYLLWQEFAAPAGSGSWVNHSDCLRKLSITNDAACFLSQCKSTYSFKVKLRLKTSVTPTQCLPIHFFSFLNYCSVFKMTTKSGSLADTVTDFLWHSAALLMRNNPPRVKIMPPSYLLGFRD